MPPTTPNNVDGIKPPAPAPTGPPQRPAEQKAAAPVQQVAQAQPAQSNTVDLKAEALNASKQPTLPKSKPKVSNKSNGPVVIILLTLVVMIALIGLAYFAYNKSK